MAQQDLTGEERDALLRRAADAEVSLRLKVQPDAGAPLHFQSRLLAISQRSVQGKTRFFGLPKMVALPVIVAEKAAADGHEARLAEGAELDVFFVQGEQYFAFRSRVIEFAVHRLNEGQRVQAVLIEYPEVIQHIQERQAFRVDISVLNPVPVALTMYNSAGKPAARATGSLGNISVGGVAVRFRAESTRELALRTGERIGIAFQIPDGPQVSVDGVIRSTRIANLPAGGVQKLLGVEFDRTALEPFLPFIHGWVMERQREILKKRK